MDRDVAKELLHIEGWLERVDEIVDRGESLTTEARGVIGDAT